MRLLLILIIVCITAGIANAQCRDFRVQPALDPFAANDEVHHFHTIDFGQGPKLVASGYFTQIAGQPRNRNAVWNGVAWESLPVAFPSTTPMIVDVEWYDDGAGLKQYAALDAPYNGDVTNGEYVVRWNGSGWQPVPGTSQTLVTSLKTFQNELYAAGFFSRIGSTVSESISSWNGTRWRSFARVGPAFTTNTSASAYDTVNQRVLCVVAPSQFTLPTETWSWDGVNWTLLNATLHNAGGRNLVYDSNRQRFLMLDNAVLRVWNSQMSAWEVLPTQFGPPEALVNFGMVYDTARDRVVLFGGYHATEGLNRNQTWEFDGTAWQLINLPLAPAAREYPHMAYDSTRQRTVLFGGHVQLGANDTWEYNGSAWVQRTPSNGSPPPFTNDAQMFYDAGLQSCILVQKFGDQEDISRTWRWNGTSWSNFTTGGHVSGNVSIVVHHPLHRKLWVLGYRFNELQLDAATWTVIPELRGISGGIQAMETYDDGSGLMLHVAGPIASTGGITLGSHARFDGNMTWYASPVLNSQEAGANFKTLLKVTDGSLAGLYSGGVLLRRWNGSNWTPVSSVPRMSGIQSMLPITVDGSQQIMIAGAFSDAEYQVNGVTQVIENSPGLISWTGTGLAATPGVRLATQAGIAYSLATLPGAATNRIVVGGDFNFAGTNAVSNMTIWGDDCSAPVIVEQPTQIFGEVNPVTTIRIRTRAGGTGPLSYRWFRDGELVTSAGGRISGMTSNQLQTTQWSLNDAGEYMCEITGPLGTVLTQPHTLAFPMVPADGPVDFTIVDYQPASSATGPGLRGSFETQFFQPPNRVIYSGRLSTASQPWSAGLQQIWAWDVDTRTTLIGMPGVTPHAPNVPLTFLTLDSVSGLDGAIFRYGFSTPSIGSGVAVVNAQQTRSLAYTGMSTPSLPGQTFASNVNFNIRTSPDGQFAWFSGTTNTGDRGWWSEVAPSVLQRGPVSRTPTPTPGYTWATANNLSRMSPGNDGLVAFAGSYNRNDQPAPTRTGYWGPEGEAVQLRLGSTMSIAGTNYTVVGVQEAIRVIGGAWIAASLQNPQGTRTRLIFVGDNDQITLLPEQVNIPGTNWNISSYGELLDARGGCALFTCSATPVGCAPPCTSQSALVLRDAEDVYHLILIKFVSDVPGELHGFTIQNAYGTVTASGAVLMRLEGNISGAGLIGWTKEAGLFPVAALGTQVEISQGNHVTVSESLTPFSGQRIPSTVLRDDGRFAFQARFTNGGHAVLAGDMQSLVSAWSDCSSFIVQPMGLTAPSGGQFAMNVRVATRSTPLLRWHRNGVPLFDGSQPDGSIVSGASTTECTISSVSLAFAGSFSCVLTDSCGIRESWAAEIIVHALCDPIDFNNDTSLFDPQDIEAFLSVYSEGPCVPAAATCNDIDFNNDTSLFDPCDISSFLVMYSEGPCTPCG